MGSPKALLTWDGETFLDRLIGHFQTACSQVIVVLGHEPERIRSAATLPVEFVFNPDHQLGQLTSLQCGLRSLRADIEAVFFTPVDYPAISAGTVRTLLHSYTGRELAVVPKTNGKHGHPVLVAAQIIPEFLALPPDRSARDIMHRHIDRTVYVDVNDAGTLHDVDDPDSYDALQRVMS
jgi:molybdenum cofactor cytidylyltransferase